MCLWTVTGYFPFTAYGERFAITPRSCPVNDPLKWQATHLETGAALGQSKAKNRKAALLLAKRFLRSRGRKLLLKAVRTSKARIAG